MNTEMKSAIKLCLRNEYQDYFQGKKDKADRSYLLGLIEGCWISGQIPNKEDYKYLTEYAMDEELEDVVVTLDKIFFVKTRFKNPRPKLIEKEFTKENLFDGLLPKEEPKKEVEEIDWDNLFEGLI